MPQVPKRSQINTVVLRKLADDPAAKCVLSQVDELLRSHGVVHAELMILREGVAPLRAAAREAMMPVIEVRDGVSLARCKLLPERLHRRGLL